MPQDFLTISELNNFVKDVINAGFPQPVWVCGEIQQYERNKSKKHVFFELVEKDPKTNEVKARIGLVIFDGKKLYLDQILKESQNAFALKDDIEVKFLCKVDFYAPHGALRLIVESIDPFYTIGKIAQERQKLIKLLKEAGVLDKNKQLALPEVPLNIGLITAFDSAAYNDFFSELKQSGYAFRIFLRDAVMQGKNSEKDVCAAIKDLRKVPSLDVILITRGGGSIADLSCFDSKMIAEAIADCPLPVLSGIGHEINTTITDLAAHTFAKTPTAIAQFLVQRVQDFMVKLDESWEHLTDQVDLYFETQNQRLKNLAMEWQVSTHRYFKEQGEVLVQYDALLKIRPRAIIKEARAGLTRSADDLASAVRQHLSNEQKQIENFNKVIEILHPVNTLKRGFSITRNSIGKTLRSKNSVILEDFIETEFADGKVQSKVNNIE